MTTKQMKLSTAAAAKREARQQAHAAMMARQTARREAIRVYEVALTAWQDAGYTGPAPLDPRYWDMSLFPENKNDD
jgi:hypothetical protein